MSLLEYRTVHDPQYLELVEITIKHEKVHWFEHEAQLSTDVEQWKQGKITPEEKSLISNILRLFTQSDIAVGQSYYERLIPPVKNTEARSMLGCFAARESIHHRAYALLTDTLGFSKDFYWEFLDYHEMREKYEFMVEQVEEGLSGFASYLAKQVLVEGVALFASFAILLNFDRLGKLPGMCDVIRWSSVDEHIHCEGNTALFRIFVDENPEIVNNEFKTNIYDCARQLVALEDSFVDKAFSLGGVENLTAEEVKDYIRYVTDYRLLQLGLKPNWGLDHPIPWIDGLMGKSLANMFERSVVEYSKSSLKGEYVY